ncbi:ROK family protein [Candidatus Saccharibacteria bacterium]|nr:ROK family protein [Candidatus Saccharibacteria bacterium]MCA9328309.1 ROK family protein [Candidatus Saccharibacteria bacterium]
MYVSIDVGGSKVLVATFDEHGKIINTKKFKTPIMYPDFIHEVKKVYRELTEGQEPSACAIALPGTIDRENGIVLHFGNLPWENVHIRDDLQDTIHCPMLLENDAKLAGLAEANELKDLYKRVLYVTVSTGIGLGLTVDGKIDYSVSDAGGRAIMLEYRGKILSWEEFGSGKALKERSGKLASDLDDDSSEWYVIARNIAIGLINQIVSLSPDCVVIGGGVGTHLPKFHERLHEELELYRSEMITKMPQIVQAKHPEEAVIYGGYLLCTKQ